MQTPEVIVQAPDMFIWQNDDIVRRLHIRKGDWLLYAKTHEDELQSIGAIVKSGQPNKSAKYRVSVMRPWVDEHLEDIFGGKP